MAVKDILSIFNTEMQLSGIKRCDFESIVCLAVYSIALLELFEKRQCPSHPGIVPFDAVLRMWRYLHLFR